MYRARIIPCLLLKNHGLVKTTKFREPIYIGDPINAIRIFNEKEVDELIFLDICATAQNTQIRYDLLERIATECFMPVCYGGGVKSIEVMRDIFSIGIEKISISSHAVESPRFISEAADKFGSQSIVVCMDVKKNFFGKYEIVTNSAGRKTGIDPLTHAVNMERMGAGELLLNSVDRDGTMLGYDIELIKNISNSVGIPVIACGGAGKIEDFRTAVREGGASAAAAGSLFVFYGKHKAVLITYPSQSELKLMNAEAGDLI